MQRLGKNGMTFLPRATVQYSLLVIMFLGLFAGWTAFAKIACLNCGYVNDEKDRYCISCTQGLKPELISQNKGKFTDKASKPGLIKPKIRLPVIIILSLFGAALFFTLLTTFKKPKYAPVMTDLDKTRMFLSVQAEGVNVSNQRGPAPRRFDRKDTKIPVMLKTEEGVEFKGLVCDVSLGGLGLVTKDKIEKGDRVQIYFSLKDGGNIKITGTAVFVSQITGSSFRTGLQFYHLFTEQENFIQELVNP
jgi:hypothetical protein